MRVPVDEQATPTTQPGQARKGRGRHSDIDAAIGTRIRAARFTARMSQTELGRLLGFSYQQVQKYETGKDRVSASTLQRIAEILGVHPGSFFDNGPMPSGNVWELRGAMKLAEVASQIHSPRILKHLLGLAQALVGSAVHETEPRTDDSAKTH